MLRYLIIVLMYVRMRNVQIYNNKTKITLLNKTIRPLQALFIIGVVAIFALTVVTMPFAQADQLQDKINALNAENSQKKQSQNVLSVEAGSLNEAITNLQAQIDAGQKRIATLQGDIDLLNKQIVEAEAELAKQKGLLGQTIKAMYLEGDITTVEMLASSKNLSDFFDKQQYRESVRSKIKSTLDTITQLKLDLSTKKDIVEKSLTEQQRLTSELASQRAEKDRVLSLNQGEQNRLNDEMKQNSSKIAQLRAQQIAANARLFGGGVRSVPDSSGYPWASYRAGSWTHGGSCYYGDDIDPWGMCYRQCVSYAAWKVYKAKGYMPYWGGRGNANQWDDNARAAGIPVDTNPGSGNDGTIAVSNSGTWGHVMYVESVNPNGTINISQYNVSLTGTYSEATISQNGLIFIHF